MVTTLLSLVAPDVVMMTAYDDTKVGIMVTRFFCDIHVILSIAYNEYECFHV